MKRRDGRKGDQLRNVKIHRNYIKHAEGSALIEVGDTKVICTATIEDKVPPHLKGKNKGWITAEYAMIPRSALQRIVRESARGKIGGRTHEIQRLIGRSLRSFVALVDAIHFARKNGLMTENPIKDYLAAVSVGVVDGEPFLDLNYDEDSTAEVDMNIVMTGKGKFVEVQGTAEGEPFSRNMMDGLVTLAKKGIEELVEMQRKLVGEI